MIKAKRFVFLALILSLAIVPWLPIFPLSRIAHARLACTSNACAKVATCLQVVAHIPAVPSLAPAQPPKP